jgi:hypothetical protein
LRILHGESSVRSARAAAAILLVRGADPEGKEKIRTMERSTADPKLKALFRVAVDAKTPDRIEEAFEEVENSEREGRGENRA